MNDSELRLAYARRLARDRRAAAACPSPEALVALVEKQGSEPERLATLDHAMSCDACRRDLELLRSVDAARVAIEGDRGAPLWRWAAAAGVVLAIAGVTTLSLRGRESAMRGGAPLLVTPSASIPATPSPQFVWRRTADAVDYRLELLSAAGDSIYATLTSDTALTLPTNVMLARGGEYIWQVHARFNDGTQAATAPLRFRIQP